MRNQSEDLHHFLLDDNIRLELLDCINDHRLIYSERQGAPVITDDDSVGVYDTQKNSIVKGEIELVQSHWLEEDFILGKTLRTFTTKVTSAWYVVMKSGDFHVLHDHVGKSGSQVSGAIYLDVPQNLPEPQGNINWILSDSVKSASPNIGDVFLWPSHLLHTVYPFRGDGERIMISFNGKEFKG